MRPEALVERLWARVFALRALAVVTAAMLLLLCLAGGAWAQTAAALEAAALSGGTARGF